MLQKHGYYKEKRGGPIFFYNIRKRRDFQARKKYGPKGMTGIKMGV